MAAGCLAHSMMRFLESSYLSAPPLRSFLRASSTDSGLNGHLINVGISSKSAPVASDKTLSKSFVRCVLTPRITKHGRISDAALTKADQYLSGSL
ncbi:hypothetical protein TRFO_18129 [Tritrichomonas foetus]|uniref:Uncharacterized protein n=1 Tax=Tritrichomonas foetus TaxID=1144522 RepID=A0A1J4KMU2_9EUKA|nr:hypothetical protein TRFO_18129 [Tritrichomonas foetus]|eukprot:OHT12216.1 hypothetical protein TRFO_18129 [Tritrichomonas foetus]